MKLRIAWERLAIVIATGLFWIGIGWVLCRSTGLID
jgi:hypothetical protein